MDWYTRQLNTDEEVKAVLERRWQRFAVKKLLRNVVGNAPPPYTTLFYVDDAANKINFRTSQGPHGSAALYE